MELTKFPKDFRESIIKEIFTQAQTGKFCQLVCAPGAGKATILKLMTMNSDLQKLHLGEKLAATRIIYLDLHELESFDRENIEKFLLFAIDEKIKPDKEPILLAKQLNRTFATLIEKGFNVIFLLDHFDEFQNRLPGSFFQLIKGFRTLNKYKFGVVFGTRRDIKELIDPQVLKDFYDFFVGNTLYLKIYDQKATEVMFLQIEEAFGQKFTPAQKKSIVEKTGGHAKLTKAIAETILREKISPQEENLTQRPLIKEALFELWLFLTAQEQQILSSIARDEKVQESEELKNLINFNLIEPVQSNNFKFTIPLFEQFVHDIIPKEASEKITYNPQTKEILKGANVISELLSKQEYRLLRFLVQNEGKIIERNEIIQAVWPDVQVQEGISDEAIDQMIFRLRKKIENEPKNPKHIQTVKGMGLRFSP